MKEIELDALDRAIPGHHRLSADTPSQGGG